MTLPVSSYEELLARVRSLTHETIRLQRVLSTSLVDNQTNQTNPARDHNDNGPDFAQVSALLVEAIDNGTALAKTYHNNGDRNPLRDQGQSDHCRRSPSTADTDKVLVQNGGVGGDSNSEVTGAANILARLGLVLDLQSPNLNGTTNGTHNRTTNLQNNTMHLSKEHVVEVKEEDERRTSPDDEDDSEERNKARMTNSATQTQAATPDTPSDCQNVASAGEKEAIATASLYHSAWPPMDPTLWHSGPSSLGGNVQTSSPSSFQESPGMMSASSSVAGGPLTLSGVASRRTYSQQQLGAKVEMVYGLLSMLGTHDRQDMSRTLLAMSSSPDSCVAMRQSGCLPLLVQLLHSGEQDAETRSRAAQALHNMVHAHPDDKRGRREARVLKLLEQIRLYCDTLQDGQDADLHTPQNEEGDKHPGPTIAALMKLSFDEEHRHAMCQLGGLHAIAQLIQVDHEAHGSTSDDQNCVTLRRYAGMALTNLTFGDGTNKALLCSFRQFMRALVAQLTSPSEDLRQVTASVLRNLSWRADSQSKQTLREVGAVTALMSSAMEAQKESTLKSVLSALWNLSAHCSLNKVDICAVDGALAFLVQMLSYKAPSKTLAIIENAGGILRNISSHVAVREDYRSILREHNCLQVLLQQLKSPSLTVVSNACGTLWNLSARCQEDQRALWALGAPAMLRSLVHSKHKMISMGSSATLKNLLSAKPENDDSCFRHIDSTARSLGLQSLPGLYARKQKALEQELDQTLAETCDNIEPSTSPSTSTVGLRDDKFVFSLTERDIYRQRTQQHQQQQKPAHKIRASVVSHSDSKESITSTHSDSVYERLARMGTGTMEVSPVSETRVFHPPVSLHDETKLHASLSDSDRIGSELKREKVAMSDRKFLERYNNNMMREGNGGCKSNEPVADPNQNSVAVNHIEKGLEAMNINEETPPKECSMNAWEEPNSSSSVVTKKAITSREEVGTATSISEEDEAAENAKQLNNNNVPSVNGNPVVPGARVSQPASFTAARNNYLEAGLEEDLECPAQDRPIDFSRRYPAESDPASAETAIAKKEGSNGNKETPVVYGDYAETDLDQPTDYSLQYGEEDDLSDFEAPEPNKRGDSAEFYSGQVPICIHEDTVKTYCTEGTPYETPYNFSTATSLSDLRIEPPVKEENTEDLKAAAQESSNLSDICSLPEIKDGSRQSGEPSLVVQESGSVSPAEKPVQFCEEGTPGVCMSRFSSLSSLDKQDVVSDVVDGKSTTDIAPQEVDHPAPSHTPPGTPPMCQAKEEQPLEREANKMPSLNCEQQYAEETPLMFSRASSLGSLSSYEQQSILDDRSSVVSEFSRLTSGVVSPSELPDSPSQLVPPSPRHAKAPVEFTSRLSDEGTTPLRVPTARFAGSTRPLAHPIAEKDAGVFEDRMAAYKVEDTPVEFSRATSLSSLSIDDEPRDVRDGISKSARSSLGREDGTEKADVEKELALVSEGEEEEDEDMLAACINIGMQNSRSKQSLSSQTLQTPQEAKQTQQQAHQQSQQQPQLQQPRTTGLRRPVAASSPMQRRPLSAAKPSGIPMLTGIPMPTGIPVKVSPITRRVHAPALSPAPSASPLSASRYSTPVRSHSAPGKSTNESSGACEDSMYRYCTEGTPANISHAGSHSDLSVLSFPTEGDEDRRHDHTGTELSDDSSTFSGDNENILAECIQSGMPKAKSDMSGHTPRQPHTSPANPLGNAKRVGVSNTSLAGRRVASASPSGSSKTPRSPHVSPHPSSPSRNPNNSPQRKPGTTGSPQRTYPQVTNNVPKSGARLGMKPPGANPSSSQVSTGHPGSTPPRQRPTGGARIVRAVNRNVYPGAKGPEATAIKSSCLPEASAANDEIVHFASEDSPCNFSSRSSLSDLTINSSECGPSPGVTPITHNRLPLRHPPSEGPACDSSLRFATEDTPVEGSYAPSLSSLGLGDDDHELPEIDPIIMKDAPHLRMLLRISEGSITDQAVVASAAVMVSSDGSDKLSDKQQPNPSQSSASEEVLTVLSRNASLSSLSVESLGSCEPSPSEQALLEQCINSGMPKSRTKSGDSAFKKIISKLPCPVEGPSHPRMVSTNKRVEIMKDSLPSENGATPGGQESWRVAVGSDRERPRFNSEAQSDSGSSDKAPEDVGTVEKKFNFVEDVDVMKASATSNGTWADDSSPNDISYPSISISAPIAASVRSDNYRELSDLVEENNDSASEAQDLPSLTDSWMLEAEATKVASAVMGHSLNSLDSILPPSEMGSLASLSQSYSGRSLPHTLLNRNCSRKKSLPAALNNGIDTSIEFNMSSSCTSQLENLKAPSVLDEMGDSENSFMSIASITSEAADLAVDLHKDGSIGDATYELIRPAAKLVADAYAKCAGQQVSQLDTQDPPSTFQEITELSTDQDLTLEPGTETIASDTEMNDEIADSKTLEAPDLPCDSQHTTPAQSATPSSAESTPKKESKLKKRITPKQRREMTRDRYQTYTISSPTAEQKAGPDTVQQEQLQQSLPAKTNTDDSPTPKERRQMMRDRYQTYTITTGADSSSLVEGHEVRKSATVGDVPDALKKKARTTPKQRRQEDRDRFRTRTLEKDSITGAQ